MKKLLFVTVFSTLAVIGYGQARLELGVKGGMNFSNLHTGDDFDADSKTGYHAGIYGLVKIGNIGIQPEVLYSRQGATLKESFGGFTSEYDSKLMYLNIPVMVKFYLPLGLNIQAGPQFGVLVSAKGDGHDASDSYKKQDVSAAVGLGWDAPFGIRLNARYLMGFNNIDDTGYVDQKNRMFQLSVGYALIKLGK